MKVSTDATRELEEMAARVADMLQVVDQQQDEIRWLTTQLENKLAAEQRASGRHDVFTALIDKDTLKPIGKDRGKGVVMVPTFPIVLDNDSRNGGTLFDEKSFMINVDDIVFHAPFDITDPWIGMFDVVTQELVIIYRFKVRVLKTDSLHITFKSKMVAW